jgi:phosphonopyruvate decarboxylase
MLTSETVMRHVLTALPNACVVSTCGYPSRELYNSMDRPGNLYLLGSMGMAAPVAYGIAATLPGRPVVAIDGDGSIAMNLGCLALAAELALPVVHLVLDNGMHQSTGGQSTLLPNDLAAVAAGAGYPEVVTVRSSSDLAEVDGLGGRTTPLFIHAIVAARTAAAGHRIRQRPQELVGRVRAFLDDSAPESPMR